MAAAKPVRRYDEDKLQASIVAEYRKQFDCLVFSVPNGGNRNPREAAKLKWTGVLAGIPDLIALGRDGRALFIECKTPKGKESPVQEAIMDDLWDRGFTVHTVRDLDTALAVGRAFGLEPKRAATRSAAALQTGF